MSVYVTKLTSSSSDSEDSADRNPLEAKKSKMGSRTDIKEPTWKLQKNKLVRIRKFKGKVFVDIRKFYERDGQMFAGLKGISISQAVWAKLLELGEDINETLNSMCI
ncbi:RNA polymerase II transcriptional coactivator-like [Bicyclus anynana]|uniref:RNA polymerase II transcriptional coactivator-like n=1 Tax=Bicyclus anynana TaxID=110368 RepID=A0A6J1MFQ1_BICAN|nr:RNA polymerase II transcriptional coactivator-like [Bicyclus anynana]